MEAEAFVSDDIGHLVDTGLSFVPSDCLIARVIGDVRRWVEEDGDWYKTRQRIDGAYGYHKFEGESQVISNYGLMIMAVLYARSNFHQAMHITATSGWDTGSNGGSVGCLVAIISGLQGFEGGPDWRGPVADRALIPTADSDYAINNAVRLALDLANLGRQIRGTQPLPPPRQGAQFHFFFPGGVQGFRCPPNIATRVEQAMNLWGKPSLAIHLFHHGPMSGPVEVVTDTHHPVDLPPTTATIGQRYPLAASPLVYPGQTVRARLSTPFDGGYYTRCCLIVKTYDLNGQVSTICGPSKRVWPSRTAQKWTIPKIMSFHPIHAIGIQLSCSEAVTNTVWLDYLRWKGTPKFTFRLPNVSPATPFEPWKRAWVGSAEMQPTWDPPSFTVVKSAGEGILTIGTREWTDYSVAVKRVKVKVGGPAGVIFRAQGLNRWYGLLLTDSGTRVSLIKAQDEKRTVFAFRKFSWALDVEYDFSCSVVSDFLRHHSFLFHCCFLFCCDIYSLLSQCLVSSPKDYSQKSEY